MFPGHAAWPAIVIDESRIRDSKILKSIQGDKGVVVQFFGTYDFARFNILTIYLFFCLITI